MNNLLVTCNHLSNEIDSFDKELSSFNVRVPDDNPQTIKDESMKLLLKDVDIAIIGDDIINQVALSEANKLKHVIKWGVGFDNVELDSLKNKNISFYHTPGVFSDEVADLALGFLLSIERGIHITDVNVRNGIWGPFKGRTLRNKVAGIIGLGSIGCAINDRLLGFGVKTIGHDPYIEPVSIEKVDLDILLTKSDYIFIACNMSDENKELINSETLEKIKEGSVIINISRGGLINENDLIDSINSGKIRSVGLDVFNLEPPNPEIFLGQSSVFGSHGGSSTVEAVHKINKATITLARRILEGASYLDLPVKKIT